jgi:hypothetical protein
MNYICARPPGLLTDINCINGGIRFPEAATCLVFNLDKGEHIHFVDSANGSFTAAAKKMKAAGR